MLGLEAALVVRFDAEGECLASDLCAVEEVAVLETVAERLKAAATVVEVRALLDRPDNRLAGRAGAGEE